MGNAANHSLPFQARIASTPAASRASAAHDRTSSRPSSDVPNSDTENATGPSHIPRAADRRAENGVRARKPDIALRRTTQQLGDFVLHAFYLVEPQLRIGHDEDVASCAMFVNQNTPIRTLLRLHLFQDAFALEHRGENIASVRRR